jgi:TetR/AcrR family transcriptional regulator, mexJK operon transcriptional repressor
MESLDRAAPLTQTVSAKKQSVLNAALRLFLEQGYGTTSMDAIAREAGVSKATLYAHVKNKEELFAAITASCANRHVTPHYAFETGHDDIRTELLRFARDHVAFLLSEEGAAMYRIVIAEAPRFPELGRAFFANGPAVKCGALADYLKNADQRGLLKIDDASLAACELIALAGGVLHLRAMLGLAHEISAKEQEAVIEHGVDAFLRAYRA